MNIQPKPTWLRKPIVLSQHDDLNALIGDLHLNTICKEGLCPNISECYKHKQATFLIMGTHCTRQCRFCNVTKAKPLPLQDDEPQRIAEAIFRMGLRFVVITSPTRDDLPDGGAEHFAKTVDAIHEKTPNVGIEILIPDFMGKHDSLDIVKRCKPLIISHNLETVSRLYEVRKGADYKRSLDVLEYLADNDSGIKTKSGIMLGLGETKDEVVALMHDLLSVGCRLLSIGQYLQPSKAHYPLQEYIKPEIFDEYKQTALDMGFTAVESAPYVRSSYMAERYVK